MENKGTSTRMNVSSATPVITWSVMRRRKAMGAAGCSTVVCVISGIGPRRLAAGDGPHQQPRQRVDYDRNQEQRQANLDQGGEINIPGSLAELVGQHAGHGVARREQRLRNL